MILKIEQVIESNKLIEQRLLKIEKLLDFNEALNQRLSKLEQHIESNCPISPNKPYNSGTVGSLVPSLSYCATFLLEVEESKRRSANLMVYNFPDNDNNPDDDERGICQLFEDIVPENAVKKVFRIGKKTSVCDENVQRPLKLVLNDCYSVLAILKNRDKIASSDYPRFKISSDLTSQQRQHLKLLREQLNTRISSGENNLTIKYISGVPQIVS
ncbi:hypothetical protein JTB14_024776 [Gonioctena quinquepunctata]|nr:hypothetical protein JTB14_024776 [Gonioctena quinquepunctata]